MHTEGIFGAFLLLNGLVTFRTSPLWDKYMNGGGGSSGGGDNDGIDPEEKTRHRALMKKYLLVYLLATLGDWLQGPYVYALYASYGYSQHDNATLFVAGFGSSMIFGSFIGGMADWGGRRNFVVLYALTYAASCMTKHFQNYHMLMIGRLLGGVSTSLLFSIFETWLVRAHADNKIGKTLLNKSFSQAQYYNSIVAIVAGLLANKAADFKPLSQVGSGSFHMWGYVSPFDLSLMVCLACAFFAQTTWEENYGDNNEGNNNNEGDNNNNNSSADDNNANGKGGSQWYSALLNAYTVTIRSREILFCGLISSLFEGSMYVFVFMWTPLLTSLQDPDNKESLSFGLIFATFMVSCMAGSSIFSFCIGKVKGEALGVGVFCVAAVAMFVISSAQNDNVAFVGMNVFEVCVGMYFPIMGTMKGAIVPEDKRAAIYNLYRIPLNVIVLFNLLSDFTPETSYRLNGCMLAVATVLQILLMKHRLNIQNMDDLKTKSLQPSSSMSSPSSPGGGNDQIEASSLQPLVDKV